MVEPPEKGDEVRIDVVQKWHEANSFGSFQIQYWLVSHQCASHGGCFQHIRLLVGYIFHFPEHLRSTGRYCRYKRGFKIGDPAMKTLGEAAPDAVHQKFEYYMLSPESTYIYTHTGYHHRFSGLPYFLHL